MATPEQNSTDTQRLSWSKGLAPRYIALFLLVVFYDQLAPRTLAVGGVAPAAIGALIAGLLCNFVFFQPMARLGLRTRETIEGVGRHAFGETGGRWVVGGVLAACQVMWFAVGLHYAIECTFRALSAAGLLAPSHWQPVVWLGRLVPGPLYLWVGIIWSLTAALLGTVAFRLAAAVMAGYQAFPALALAAAVAWALPATRQFVPIGRDELAAITPDQPGLYSILLMIQLVCGYFVTHAALGVDWGKASDREKDVRWGGMVGITLASATLAVLALLVVAGARGRDALAIGASAESIPRGWRDYTLLEILTRDVGGLGAAAGLITLGLALLGPVCFTPYLFARLVQPMAPRVPKLGLTVLAAVLTWPLLLARFPTRLDVVFTLLGALGAPLVGVLSAVGSEESATTGRHVNLAAIAAWLAGVGIGLVPLVGPALGASAAARFQPAVLWAYAISFVLGRALVRTSPRRVS